MVNLEEKTGLPARLLDDGKLSFSPDVDVETVSIRKLSDLKSVVMDQDIELSDDTAYTMYRNVKLSFDAEKISDSGLRFDLTVIPPVKIGNEYIKTSGHTHPAKPGTEVTYPELYYVIFGRATCLMQKSSDGLINDVIVSNLSPGEAIVVPPGYGHVTINEADETLVMANWVSDNFESNYSEFEKYNGGAYYIVDKLGSPGMIMNKNYEEIPAVRGLKSEPKIIGDKAGRPIYSYINDLQSLRFLRDPDQFINQLSTDQLFK